MLGFEIYAISFGQPFTIGVLTFLIAVIGCFATVHRSPSILMTVSVSRMWYILDEFFDFGLINVEICAIQGIFRVFLNLESFAAKPEKQFNDFPPSLTFVIQYSIAMFMNLIVQCMFWIRILLHYRPITVLCHCIYGIAILAEVN